MCLHWQRGQVAYLSGYSFLICFLTVSICFPSGWKSAAIDHPLGDACTDRLQPRSRALEQGCCPCEALVGVLRFIAPGIPLIPWPLGPGTARQGIIHQDKQLCLARSERRREARDLWCKCVREKPRGWGMWSSGLFCESYVQCVRLERPCCLRAKTVYDYHIGLQETKGPISPSLLFLQGLAVVSEPKHAMICFVTWQANVGHHLGCQGNVFRSASWKFLECQQNPMLSAEWI